MSYTKEEYTLMSQFTFVRDSIVVLTRWYRGQSNTPQTAELLVLLASKHLDYTEHIFEIIKYVATMPDTPDNYKGSNSVWSYFTDIDTEAHHQMSEYDEMVELIQTSMKNI